MVFRMVRQHPYIVVAAALVGGVVLAGCGSGARHPSRSSESAAVRPLTPAVATTGRGGGGAVSLLDYTDNDGAKSSVVLTGAIGDYGVATSVNAAGSVDPEHKSQLMLALHDGSFRMDIASIDKKLVDAFSRFPSNLSTCSGTVVASDDAPIVVGTGTGTYAGIRGSFRLTVTIAEVDAKAHCSASSAFLSQAVVTAGSGTVELG